MQPENDIVAKAAQSNWPNPIKLSIWLVCEDDQWSALASEFDVVGMGGTKEAAMENLMEMVAAYLASYMQEGVPFEEARRPIPFRERVRLGLAAFRTTASDRLPARTKGTQHDHVPRAVRHSHLDMTPQGTVVC
jgi:predicted RNase H-like HicB family nuclease